MFSNHPLPFPTPMQTPSKDDFNLWPNSLIKSLKRIISHLQQGIYEAEVVVFKGLASFFGFFFK